MKIVQVLVTGEQILHSAHRSCFCVLCRPQKKPYYSGMCYNEECYKERMLQRTNNTRNDATTNECYNERMLQRTNATTNEWYKEQCYNERMLQRTNATTNECYKERMLQRTNATTNEWYKEQCYNERVIQGTMLQQTNDTRENATTKEW